jgi:Dolichyl-phosphate-mannose-protein mannosyltransferase
MVSSRSESPLIRSYLTACVLLGTLAVASVELLSAFHALAAWAIRATWMIAAFVAIATLLWRARIRKPKWPGSINAAIVASMLGILAIIFLTAILSPPNSSDAMAYHLPRVVYWIQQRSVHFFATPYLNQIMLQPFAEYLMLHTVLLSGGDHFVNLVQWFGCATSVVAVAGIAGRFGAPLRGQLLAALFCATIPNGILQASGAKNDYILAAWLAATVYFLLRPDETRFTPLLAGLALGLAIGTKATAYLFAPGVVLFAILREWRWWRAHLGSARFRFGARRRPVPLAQRRVLAAYLRVEFSAPRHRTARHAQRALEQPRVPGVGESPASDGNQ